MIHIAVRLFLAFFVSLLPNIEFTPLPQPPSPTPNEQQPNPAADVNAQLLPAEGDPVMEEANA